MANDLSANPWKVDTASATALWNDIVWLENIIWHEPTTAGHRAEVTDMNGKVIGDLHALAAGSGMEYRMHVGDGPYMGLIVPVLESGVLYIHIK